MSAQTEPPRLVKKGVPQYKSQFINPVGVSREQQLRDEAEVTIQLVGRVAQRRPRDAAEARRMFSQLFPD